jgi:signal transduction histidine kinase
VSPLLVSALVAGAVGTIGTAAVLVVARRWVRAAAVAAPIVVVLSMAAGVAASVQTMAISDAASRTIVLVLLATVPMAVVVGLVLAWQLGVRDRAVARRESELERDHQVELRRRELVSWMSHDLRTPLAGITAMTEALRDGIAPDPGAYIERLHAEAGRLDGMVGDLVALSRLQSPGGRLPRQDVLLGDLVSGVVEQLAPVAARAGVLLTGQADPSASVRVDPKEVARAVTNLVVNGIRYTPSGSEVRVVVSQADGRASVEVRDACGGIAAPHLPHLFEPGWRASEGRAPTEGAGAGLGLAITRAVAEAHGGTVDVRNEPPGCVFELRLPATAAS